MLNKNKKNTLNDNYHWIVFYTVAIALFAMVLDFSIVILALPTIADQFEVSLKAVSWVIISSSLITSAFMLPLGAISDVIGRKKFHISGMVFFVLGAILCYTSTSLEHLIFGRIIMAIGKANVDLNPNKISIKFGNISIVENGKLLSSYDENKAAQYMKEEKIDLLVNLNIGKKEFTSYTMDLTKKYIEINSDYRT